MRVTQNIHHRGTTSWSSRDLAHVTAWLVATLLFINTLYFVWRAASPVLHDDAWYFLDVFLGKAIHGDLGLADFFVKRPNLDHAQPLYKLLWLLEWRYFDLDLSIGAIAGVLAATASALVFHRVLLAQWQGDRGDILRYLTWAGICALLFSLNADAGEWTWPLVAFSNVTNLIVLLFFLAVWRAHQRQRHGLLALATLFLGISSDDSALIAVIAAVLALLLMQFADPVQRQRSTWKVVCVIALCTILVRIGYAWAPVVGAASPVSMTSQLGLLFERLLDHGWWKWAVLPLTLPVFYRSAFPFVPADAFGVLQVILGILLLAAHAWFWWKALRSRYNRPAFVAVCLMLFFYGSLAGIILGRVSTGGNDYLEQPRYIVFYAGHLIALLLMWAGGHHPALPSNPSDRTAGRRMRLWLGVTGCVALLIGQIPPSIHAWRMQPYLEAAYATLAARINRLALDPEHMTDCLPGMTVCDWVPARRRQLTQLLSRSQLNVFSPQVQRRHSYLPRLSPVPAEPALPHHGSPGNGSGHPGVSLPARGSLPPAPAADVSPVQSTAAGAPGGR